MALADDLTNLYGPSAVGTPMTNPSVPQQGQNLQLILQQLQQLQQNQQLASGISGGSTPAATTQPNDIVKQILGGRFESEPNFSDVADATLQSAMGHTYVSPDTLASGRLASGLAALKTIGEYQKDNAMSSYYTNGGASANSPIAAMDPDGNPVFIPKSNAVSGGYRPLPQAPMAVIDSSGNPTFAPRSDVLNNPSAYKPVQGFNNTNVTLDPNVIDMQADAIASGATPQSLGLGIGNNANKAAVFKRVAEKYPDLNLADAQVDITGKKAGARTIANAGGRINLAGESLTQMIPLAEQASQAIDRTQYPSLNALQNAVAQGTGDPNIVKLVTYLNAVQSDHAALMVRSGATTDSARQKAYDMANAAFSKGQLSAYFNSVEQEKQAQGRAIDNALMRNKTGNAPTQTNVMPNAPTSGSDFSHLWSGQ